MLKKVYLFLLFVLLVPSMTFVSGCALFPNCVTATSYYNPSWLPNGKIICTKFVNTYEQNLMWGGSKDISKDYYITTMNEDGSGEQDVKNVTSINTYIVNGEIATSPDGAYIAVAANSKIEVFDSNFNHYKSISPSGYPEHLDFSPTSEGYKIVYTNSSNELRLTDIDGSVDALITTEAESVAWRVGDKIVFVTSTGTQSALTVSSISLDGTNIQYLKEFAGDPQILNNAEEVIYRGVGNEIRKIGLNGSDDLLLFSDYEVNSLKLSFDNTKIVGGELQQSDINGVYVTDISTGLTTQL